MRLKPGDWVWWPADAEKREICYVATVDAWIGIIHDGDAMIDFMPSSFVQKLTGWELAQFMAEELPTKR